MVSSGEQKLCLVQNSVCFQSQVLVMFMTSAMTDADVISIHTNEEKPQMSKRSCFISCMHCLTVIFNTTHLLSTLTHGNLIQIKLRLKQVTALLAP